MKEYSEFMDKYCKPILITDILKQKSYKYIFDASKSAFSVIESNYPDPKELGYIYSDPDNPLSHRKIELFNNLDGQIYTLTQIKGLIP
jgi:hypothetical protein